MHTYIHISGHAGKQYGHVSQAHTYMQGKRQTPNHAYIHTYIQDINTHNHTVTQAGINPGMHTYRT